MAALHRGLLSSVQLRLGPKAAKLSGAPLRSQLAIRWLCNSMSNGKLNLASNLHDPAALTWTAHISHAPTNSLLLCRSHGGRNLQGRHELTISQSKNEPEPEVCMC